MATNNFTNAGDDAADAVAHGGEQAGAGARQAGARYDDAVDDLDGRARSIEDAIRANPLAAAGAALLVGVVLGRFIL